MLKLKEMIIKNGEKTKITCEQSKKNFVNNKLNWKIKTKGCKIQKMKNMKTNQMIGRQKINCKLPKFIFL